MLKVDLIGFFSVSDTYLQQESNSDDVLMIGNISNATSSSSIGIVDLETSTEEVVNDVLTTQSDVVVKSKSKMFFNFGSKKEKQKDIL